jgi:protein TonB
MVQSLALLGILSFLLATPPRRLNRKGEDPQYSEEARLAHINGRVVLRVIIGTDGLVKDVKVVESVGYGLDENCVSAVRTWEFTPATDDAGNAVEYTTRMGCDFHQD